LRIHYSLQLLQALYIERQRAAAAAEVNHRLAIASSAAQQKVCDGRHFLIFFLSPRVCSMKSSDAIDDRLPKLRQKSAG
jgi:hypothetical protein